MEINQLTEHIYNANTSKELLKMKLISDSAERELIAVISKNVEEKIIEKNETAMSEVRITFLKFTYLKVGEGN